MAAYTVYLRSNFHIDDGTANGITGGDIINADTITLGATSYVKDETNVIADSTTWDFWDKTTDTPITDFDFLWVLSTGVVYIELVTDKDADVGTEVSTVTTLANVPFVLTNDTSMSLHDVDFAGTETPDVIDQIRIRNVSGGALTVRAVIAT